ncbi:MAG: hypothetical protein ACLP52_15055 [Streptosporangiaceae bacterium]
MSDRMRITSGGRPLAGWPLAGWPLAGWPLAGWPTAAAMASVLLLAGCGGSTAAHSAASHAAPRMCGNARTAAGVPVHVQVRSGSVSCTTAVAVEKAYSRAVAKGQAPGNGGGGPVRVDGWTCHGFSTPVVLKTGNASQCVAGAKKIMAVLPTPS